MKNDRAKTESANFDVSYGSLGDDLRSFLGQPVETKPGRTRNLRSSFRVVPGDQFVSAVDPGFPGTRAFAPRSADGRARGSDLPAKAAGADIAPAAAQGADKPARRRSPFQAASAAALAQRSALPAGKGPGRRGVRGRPPGSKNKAAAGIGTKGDKTPAELAKKPIPDNKKLVIGVRVCILDSDHPWNGHVGAVVSEPEQYGLGWWGQRVKLDGNAGEAFVRPEQVKKVTQEPDPVLPKAIARMVAKDAVPSSTPKYVPTETERADARRLFREIGERFNENRKKSKTAAYAAYRHDLMANLDTLIMGGAIDLKEATTIITNLEQYTKETEAESTETPATILGRWLRMDAVEIGELEKPVIEEESGEEVDELDATADPADDGNSEAVS